MKNNSEAAVRKKQVTFRSTAVLWFLLAVLIMAILVLCFSLIWRDRTQTHAKDECTLLADAVLKQSAVEQKRIEKSDQFLETYLCTLNALSGWAWAYGGTNEEELKLIWDSAEHVPDGTAVFRDGESEVLLGTFPEEEFRAALTQSLEERDSRTAEEDAESSSVLFTDGEKVYLSSLLPHARTIVISRMASVPELNADSDQELDLMKLAGSLLSDAGVGIAMIRLSDHTVLQSNGIPELQAGDCLEAEPDENGRLVLGGTRYIAGVSEDASYRVLAVIPKSAIFSKTIVSPITLALVFTAVFLLTGLYAWFLRTDYLRGRVEEENPANGREHVDELLLRHVRLVFYLLAGCAVLLILLDCWLHVVDNTRVWGNRILSDVERYFEADDVNADLLASYRKEHKISVLDITRDLIEASPERMTDDALEDLSDAIERDLFVLDEDGTVVAASRREYDFSGISDPESGLYALNSVLGGKSDHKAFTVSDGETISLMCWAARCKNADRILVSMDDLTQNISFSDYYADYKLPAGLALFVVDLDTGEILSGSDECYYGKSAESIGLTEAVLQDGFAADITLNGKKCFVQTNVYGGRADVIAADHAYLLRVYTPVVLLTLVFGLLTVLLMFRVVRRLQKDVWTVSGEDLRDTAGIRDRLENADEDNAEFYREQDGSLQADRSAVGRWLSQNTPFRSQSADEKFRTVLYILFIGAFSVGVLVHEHRQSAERLDSAFTWLLQRSWSRGLNIYAVCYALLTFLLIITAALLLRRVILLLGKKLGTRGETIARMISSFIAYASIIIAFAHCLIYVGVNTTAILASAGIVGLAVSIGARDLIADILAGIFFVFEGEFRTGDIVEIGGYRGTVEEIGVRTTKVMSMENVKIFRNSNISGVINMTQRYSFAQVRVDVSRSEPFERVEALFRGAFPEIRERIPQTVSEIELCGIDQLNAKSMVLLVQTKCRESDRIEVERLLRRELDLLMERENIAAS